MIRENAGSDNLIQSAEISSTSDCFHFHENSLFPYSRRSYRFCVNIQAPTMRTDPYCSREHIPRSNSQDSFLNLSTSSAVSLALLIFVCSISIVMMVYRTMPEMTEEENRAMKVPWSIEDAKKLGTVLNRYKKDHWYQVFGGVVATYIFLQTFAIPGSLFLSILSGYLFPFFTALTLICTCSTIGSSMCFVLSRLIGRRLVLKFFPREAAKWSVIVDKQKDNLLNYMIFLRVTPILPNWFINISAPVVGMPLIPFMVGTFIGVAPPSVVAIQAGQTLQEMTDNDSTFSWTSIILLGVFAVLSLLPIFLKDRLKRKFE